VVLGAVDADVEVVEPGRGHPGRAAAGSQPDRCDALALELVAQVEELVPALRLAHAPLGEVGLPVEHAPPVVGVGHEDLLAGARGAQRVERLGVALEVGRGVPCLVQVEQQVLLGVGVRDRAGVPGVHVRRVGRGEVRRQLGAEGLRRDRVEARTVGALLGIGGDEVLHRGLGLRGGEVGLEAHRALRGALAGGGRGDTAAEQRRRPRGTESGEEPAAVWLMVRHGWLPVDPARIRMHTDPDARVPRFTWCPHHVKNNY